MAFTWPAMGVEVGRYTRSCMPCQLRARKTRLDKIAIHAVEQPTAFGDVFATDNLGPVEVPKKQGLKYILLLLDWATGCPELAPF